MRRPIIGVTLEDARGPGIYARREDYVRSLERAQALPLLLRALPAEDAALVLDRVDGILLSGGGDDVDPLLYGRPRHPRTSGIDRSRDEFEIALVREALRRDRPILGICRGAQLLNVAMGGTLLQDIPSELQVAADHDASGDRRRRSHAIDVAPRTRLAAILGRETETVNSFHHQAVERPAEGLVVSARCPQDGVVEALEAPAARFVLAVQWHPESFWDATPSFQPLFDAHAEACRS